MKTNLVGFLALTVLTVNGQRPAAGQQLAPGVSSNYTIVERGPNHRIWERVEYATAPSGEAVRRVHRYTELAVGHESRAKRRVGRYRSASSG